MSNSSNQSNPESGSPDRIVVASQSRQVNEMMGVQILASGCYAPENVIHNESLAALGYDADWIIQRTGIKSRCRASEEQACSDVAYEAARRCLDQGGIDASEIDLILLATITPDQPTPSTACHVQRMLGSNAPAMDLGAACSGFMYALVTGMQFIKTGTYKRVLIIGADLMSRTVNPADKKTFPLFGDGTQVPSSLVPAPINRALFPIHWEPMAMVPNCSSNQPEAHVARPPLKHCSRTSNTCKWTDEVSLNGPYERSPIP